MCQSRLAERNSAGHNDFTEAHRLKAFKWSCLKLKSVLHVYEAMEYQTNSACYDITKSSPISRCTFENPVLMKVTLEHAKNFITFSVKAESSAP